MTDSEQRTITAKLVEALGDDATAVDEFLSEYYEWLRKCGKNPQRNKSMAPSGAENYHDRIDQLYRFALEFAHLRAGRRLTYTHADELIRRLDEDEIRKQSGGEYASTSKRKFSDTLQKYFTWLHDTGVTAEQWEPNVVFVDGDHESADSLSFRERHQIREVALEYGSLPAYYETSPAERDRINALVAQRLGKLKSAITQRDWQQADTSAKIGSLVAVTLETGLIPIEIQNATLDWYYPRKQVFKIPAEFAAKERPTTELPLTDETDDIFGNWVRERRHLEAYDDTNLLWLNQRGNPYTSGNLCYLVRQLCEQAGIDYENRKIVWYSLRHNLGHTFEETADISATKDQLRHQYIETTKNIYGETAAEKRRHTLEEINETAKRAATDDAYSPYAPDDGSGIAVYPDLENPGGDGNTMHVDAEIEDTMAARSRLARDLLDVDEEAG